MILPRRKIGALEQGKCITYRFLRLSIMCLLLTYREFNGALYAKAQYACTLRIQLILQMRLCIGSTTIAVNDVSAYFILCKRTLYHARITTNNTHAHCVSTTTSINTRAGRIWHCAAVNAASSTIADLYNNIWYIYTASLNLVPDLALYNPRFVAR